MKLTFSTEPLYTTNHIALVADFTRKADEFIYYMQNPEKLKSDFLLSADESRIKEYERDPTEDKLKWLYACKTFLHNDASLTGNTILYMKKRFSGIKNILEITEQLVTAAKENMSTERYKDLVSMLSTTNSDSARNDTKTRGGIQFVEYLQQYVSDDDIKDALVSRENDFIFEK